MKKSALFVAGVLLVFGAAGVNPWSGAAPAHPEAETVAPSASAAERGHKTRSASAAADARPAPLVADEPAAPSAPVIASVASELVAAAAKAEEEAATEVLETLTGTASYYADYFAGRRTASGELYNPRELVAAHRTLPFGTVVRVTNQENQRSVTVRIVDRGPFAGGNRIIDLSRRAAERLDFIRDGLARVTVEVLEYGG